MIQLKNPRFLLILGIFLIAFTLIIEHYFKVSGFISGFFKGAGIAVLIVAIIWFINPKVFIPR